MQTCHANRDSISTLFRNTLFNAAITESPAFFAEQDYYRHLVDLITASNKYGVQVLAYVLMTNHVHLLLTPTQGHGIYNCMQALGRRYVRFVNPKEDSFMLFFHWYNRSLSQ
ncbi:MAG: transposase [Candidatus Thiodiazotropha sp.]